VLRGHWGELRAMPVEGAGLLAVMHAGLRCVYIRVCSIYIRLCIYVYAVMCGYRGYP